MELAYDDHWANLLILGKKHFSKKVVDNNNPLTKNLSGLFLFNKEQEFEHITKTYKPTASYAIQNIAGQAIDSDFTDTLEGSPLEDV